MRNNKYNSKLAYVSLFAPQACKIQLDSFSLTESLSPTIRKFVERLQRSMGKNTKISEARETEFTTRKFRELVEKKELE